MNVRLLCQGRSNQYICSLNSEESMSNLNAFQLRHIGPRREEIDNMLSTIGVATIEELVDKTVPASIRLKKKLDLPEGITEFEFSRHIDKLAAKNKVFRSYIGQGYYNTIVPAVIRRNVFENPGWYTAYTPYQAEISQGRLEGLLNFQTIVSDLAGLEIANASLLDEGTAAAEAAMMLYHSRSREQEKAGVNKFFVDENCFAQTIDVVKTRAEAGGVEVVIGKFDPAAIDETFFGVLVQYPDKEGRVVNHKAACEALKARNVRMVVASDLLALCMLEAPGHWGADVVVGNSQRFGVPVGFGGPHAGFFATREEFKRNLPGRIIGVSVDRTGKPALRMALQTREQHIRRDKATSNICTAQALLAIMASMYGVYHGPIRLKNMAREVAQRTKSLASALTSMGYKVRHEAYFDTISIDLNGICTAEELRATALNSEINFWYAENGSVGISLDETVSGEDLADIAGVFAKHAGKEVRLPAITEESATAIPDGLHRKTPFMVHPIFNSFQSETDMMRYISQLEAKDISLTRSMITLGSCTMKLNAASELYPISNPAFANLHPFIPGDQAAGYLEMIQSLQDMLCEITGFAGVSLQPNSGAQGEYAGLMVIRAYHHANGNPHRDVVLIPQSAHGTNPASAVVAGLKVVVVKSDEQGNINIEDLKAKASQHAENLCCLMVTYPSTHGVFEEGIMEITRIVHEYGGQVYMDGANMNAQVGLTNPATIGADVCHLNLHKTFAIPHGGGGPGMGPIGVAKHLVPFLPGHAIVKTGGSQAIGAVSSAPFGSALILLISYGYIKMLGATGVTEATKFAILNANYLKKRLEGHYPILYKGPNGMVAHEMIIDCREFKKTAGIEVTDIAKRLIDYGFHAPTVSFPVAGTLMIEPTESESQQEMDRFADALIAIRSEIGEIEGQQADKEDNVLKNAPHTAEVLLGDEWGRPYSRNKAAFPLEFVRGNKYWVPVTRIDDAFGDRNLVCTCPGTEVYETAAEATVG